MDGEEMRSFLSRCGGSEASEHRESPAHWNFNLFTSRRSVQRPALTDADSCRTIRQAFLVMWRDRKVYLIATRYCTHKDMAP